MLGAFFTQDILTQTRPRSALRQVPEDALSRTRCLSTCMGQVCFFVSKKERSDVSILPWKMEAGEDLLHGGWWAGLCRRGPYDPLSLPSKETQAHAHPSGCLQGL